MSGLFREILFRGKHVHALPGQRHLEGRWIYGYLCNENYIYSSELEGEFLIDPETVCQYTGLTDKNGMKIFEGDIVYIASEEENFLIAWDSDTARFQLSGDGCRVDFDNYWGNEVEIIDNIFDNPDLLEGNIE